LKSWYSKNKVSSKLDGPLKLERIRADGQWPKLRANAAATRHLAHFALDLVSTFGTDEDALMKAVCALLCRFYDILSSQSQFLSDAIKNDLPVLGQKLAVLYSMLAQEAFSRRPPAKLWKESPKLHLWEHLTQHCAPVWGNPAFWWTYADEDLVGSMIEIAEGVHPRTLAFSVLFKWLH
jgi:hypothetical protein